MLAIVRIVVIVVFIDNAKRGRVVATEFFIMGGDRIVDQIDIPSRDLGKFSGFIREMKSRLSLAAKAAFHVVSEYEMYPDDGEEPQKMTSCSSDVFEEIEKAWFGNTKI